MSAAFYREREKSVVSGRDSMSFSGRDHHSDSVPISPLNRALKSAVAVPRDLDACLSASHRVWGGNVSEMHYPSAPRLSASAQKEIGENARGWDECAVLGEGGLVQP